MTQFQKYLYRWLSKLAKKVWSRTKRKYTKRNVQSFVGDKPVE